MNALTYVGAAYVVLWILFIAYAWRLTSASQRIERKLEELEREVEQRDGN